MEPFYVTFTKPPATHPDISVKGYAVIEAVSIWDASDAASKLFDGEFALMFGSPYWAQFSPSYPDGEQLRVTTGAATVAQLAPELPAPEPPEISSR